MKHYGLIILLILFFENISMGAKNGFPENTGYHGHNKITAELLPSNYQQFKHQLVHLNSNQNNPPVFNFRRGTDFTILYVAGGLLLATSTFAYLNGQKSGEGYFSKPNAGIIIGGGISTGVLITKFFLDQ